MEKKTETKSEAKLEGNVITMSTGAELARRTDEPKPSIFEPVKWTPEDLDLIKKTVCPAGIPDADFKLFVARCQMAGFNPLLGEAFCIARNQNIGTKDAPNWIKVYQYTPGEQGLEGRADDFPDYRGIRAAAVYEGDRNAPSKILINSAEGHVEHLYDPADPKRGRLLGAWAIAYRDGRVTPVEYVRFEEYYDDRNAKWKSSPATMIVKCARAAALRRAYPNAFNGWYAREELDRNERAEQLGEEAVRDAAAEAAKPTTDRLETRLADRAGVRPGAQTSTSAKPTPPGQKVVDVKVEKPKAEPLPAADPKVDVGHAQAKPTPPPAEAPKTDGVQLTDGRVIPVHAFAASPLAAHVCKECGGLADAPQHSKQKLDEAVKAAGGVTSAEVAKQPPAPVDEGPVMDWGPKKGTPIAKLDGPDLLSFIALGTQKIPTLKDGQNVTAAQKAAKVRATIALLEAEMKRREAAALASVDGPIEPLAREPGDDIE